MAHPYKGEEEYQTEVERLEREVEDLKKDNKELSRRADCYSRWMRVKPPLFVLLIFVIIAATFTNIISCVGQEQERSDAQRDLQAEMVVREETRELNIAAERERERTQDLLLQVEEERNHRCKILEDVNELFRLRNATKVP